MDSKYDKYWTARLAEVADAIAEAAMGMPAIIRVSDLVNLGKRESWYGTATVSGGDVLQGDMAHLVSLAKIVAHHQLCGSASFRFTVRTDLTLAIHPVEEAAGSSRPRQPRSIVSSKVTLEVPESQETTAEAACGRIHNLLEGLPLLDRPDDIPFDDGLYFFYERSETTAHTNAQRVVRVGNHPRAAARLKPRLREHYRTSRGAKNGSVFRRYLGGALLRRSEAASPCLAPGPGAGHWERQNEPACSACTPVEQLVTSTLLERFTLRAIRIEDMAEWNAFESLLIATIAACPVCRPSGGWLGQFAYPRSIHQTGLWNTEFVGRPSMDHTDLMRFRELALASGGKEPLMGDLAKTLLVIPCSGGKKGNRTLDRPPISIVDLVDADKGRLLEEGRRLAFQRPGTSLNLDSPRKPALEYYSGQPYKTEGVKETLVGAILRGLHCVIISGGYGVLRAEEPIHSYKAHLATQTKSVWSSRLPRILRNYVARQGLESSIVLFSHQYAACVPKLTEDEYRFLRSSPWASTAAPRCRSYQRRSARNSVECSTA